MRAPISFLRLLAIPALDVRRLRVLKEVGPGVEIRPVSGSPPLRHIHAAVPADAYRSTATEAMIEVLGTVGERFATGSQAAAA